MPIYTFYGMLLVCSQILQLCAPKLHLQTQQDPDQFTMALIATIITWYTTTGMEHDQ